MAATAPSDPAKRVASLLDTISIVKDAADVLEPLLRKLNGGGNTGCLLAKGDVSELHLVQQCLNIVYQVGRSQVSKVSKVPYCLEAHDKLRRELEREAKKGDGSDVPKSCWGKESLWNVKRFIKCHGGTQRPPSLKQPPDVQDLLSPPKKKPRYSTRIVTPDKAEKILTDATNVGALNKDGAKRWTKAAIMGAITELIGSKKVSAFIETILSSGPLVLGDSTYKTANDLCNLYNEEGFKPHPPSGCRWTHESMFSFLTRLELEPCLSKKKFLQKVVDSGTYHFKATSSIFRAYKVWRKTGEIPGPMGRPVLATMDNVASAAQDSIAKLANGSSVVLLNETKQNMSELKKQKAADVGLDPETVCANVSTRIAKVNSVASAMKEGSLSLTNNKTIRTTANRDIARRSVQSALAYTATVLSTHYCAGPAPDHMKEAVKKAQEDPFIKETLNMMKEALGVDEVHPVDLHFVTSTDDTTVFGFEGTTDDGKDWEWKLVDPNKDTSVRSEYVVSDCAEHSGGLRVRFTFTMTAAGNFLPLWVTVTGLTEDELDPKLCPDGIIVEKVEGLCKEGYNPMCKGYGWLCFVRCNKKKGDSENETLSSMNRKHIHYDDKILLEYFRELRKTFELNSNSIPEWAKGRCWFDGDIPQLQIMMYAAREAIDDAEAIIRNKHSASATGTQQPCDLSPVFKLLKFLLSKMTAVNDPSVQLLRSNLEKLFATTLKLQGLNLDGNIRKKKSLFDILCCMPKVSDEIIKQKFGQQGFIDGGMIDKDYKLFPTFQALMSTCQPWTSCNKSDGIPKSVKENVKQQFQTLLKIQLEKGQISSEDMTPLGIPRDTKPNGDEVEKDRPSGPNAEHMQYAKTINVSAQRRMREEMRYKNLAAKHHAKVEKKQLIDRIIDSSKATETSLLKIHSSLSDATIADFIPLNVDKLKDFIHCRKWNDETFHAIQLSKARINKYLPGRRIMSAQEIEEQCSESQPCLVWLAHHLRGNEHVLKRREVPELDTTLVQPQLVNSPAIQPEMKRSASDYLQNAQWVAAFTATVRGVLVMEINAQLIENSNKLASALEQRLNLHATSNRVHESRRHHFTLQFTRDNIPNMAAAMSLVGHAVEDIEAYDITERLLVLPNRNTFYKIHGDEKLEQMEGCYLYHDDVKDKLIRSGFTEGDAEDTCFVGRGKEHMKNAKETGKMKDLLFYRKYPSKEADGDFGVRSGYFENLTMYCGMAMDKSKDTTPLHSIDKSAGLFHWSERVIDELKKRAEKDTSKSLKKLQLTAVAYMWELFYDLMLAQGDNVSESPGFESLGLRVWKHLF